MVALYAHTFGVQPSTPKQLNENHIQLYDFCFIPPCAYKINGMFQGNICFIIVLSITTKKFRIVKIVFK